MLHLRGWGVGCDYSVNWQCVISFFDLFDHLKKFGHFDLVILTLTNNTLNPINAVEFGSVLIILNDEFYFCMR